MASNVPRVGNLGFSWENQAVAFGGKMRRRKKSNILGDDYEPFTRREHFAAEVFQSLCANPNFLTADGRLKDSEMGFRLFNLSFLMSDIFFVNMYDQSSNE